MAWPAPSPGRPLEAEGDLRSRGMTVLARIRLTWPARPTLLIRTVHRAVYTDEAAREDLKMRLFAGIAAAAVVIAACGGTAAAPSPSPTRAPTTAPTTAPTATPSPTPTPANTFKAELKASNENPPITDAEATCAGTATVTFTATSAKFDVSITGCPATTAINIGHIHEGAAG